MMIGGRSSKTNWTQMNDHGHRAIEAMKASRWNTKGKTVNVFKVGGVNSQMMRGEACFCIHAWHLELGHRVVTDGECMTIRWHI